MLAILSFFILVISASLLVELANSPCFLISEFKGIISKLFSQDTLAFLPILPIKGQGVPAIHIASKTLESIHSVDTAATFIPIPYKDLASFILSQFKSVIVMPVAKPSI